MISSTSVFLAKWPEIFGPEKWVENENKVLNEIFELIEKNRKEKLELNIANKLIADYKSLGYNDELQFIERFALQWSCKNDERQKKGFVRSEGFEGFLIKLLISLI